MIANFTVEGPGNIYGISLSMRLSKSCYNTKISGENLNPIIHSMNDYRHRDNNCKNHNKELARCKLYSHYITFTWPVIYYGFYIILFKILEQAWLKEISGDF